MMHSIKLRQGLQTTSIVCFALLCSQAESSAPLTPIHRSQQAIMMRGNRRIIQQARSEDALFYDSLIEAVEQEDLAAIMRHAQEPHIHSTVFEALQHAVYKNNLEAIRILVNFPGVTFIETTAALHSAARTQNTRLITFLCSLAIEKRPLVADVIKHELVEIGYSYLFSCIVTNFPHIYELSLEQAITSELWEAAVRWIRQGAQETTTGYNLETQRKVLIQAIKESAWDVVAELVANGISLENLPEQETRIVRMWQSNGAVPQAQGENTFAIPGLELTDV